MIGKDKAGMKTYLEITTEKINDLLITKVLDISDGTWNGSPITNANVNDDLTIDGGSIDNTLIGATTPSTGKFTDLELSGVVTISSHNGADKVLKLGILFW